MERIFHWGTDFFCFTSLRAKERHYLFQAHSFIKAKGARNTLLWTFFTRAQMLWSVKSSEKANFREVLKNKNRIHLQHTHQTDCSRQIRGKCAPIAKVLRFPGAERPALFWNGRILDFGTARTLVWPVWVIWGNGSWSQTWNQLIYIKGSLKCTKCRLSTVAGCCK